MAKVSMIERAAGTASAGLAACIEFPAVKDVFDNPFNFVHGFGPVLTLAIVGLIIGIASRGLANIAKAGMILTGYADQYYNTTDLMKLDHPILGNLLLPMNRMRWGSRSR